MRARAPAVPERRLGRAPGAAEARRGLRGGFRPERALWCSVWEDGGSARLSGGSPVPPQWRSLSSSPSGGPVPRAAEHRERRLELRERHLTRPRGGPSLLETEAVGARTQSDYAKRLREFDDFRAEFRQDRNELREQMLSISEKISHDNNRMGEAIDGMRHQLQVYQIESLKAQVDEKKDKMTNKSNQSWSVRLSVINTTLSFVMAILMIIITRGILG